MESICPLPNHWHEIHKRLMEAAAKSEGQVPPPPKALILNGWVYSNDVEKRERWKETVEWANRWGLASLVEGLTQEMMHCVETPTNYAVGAMSGDAGDLPKSPHRETPKTHTLRPGMLVVHPNMKEWGPGKIMKLDRESAWVFWRDVEGGEVKKMVRAYVPLEPASDQSDAQLDNLPPFLETSKGFTPLHDRLTLRQAIAKFEAIFPGGFYDPKYDRDERAYKLAAYRECLQHLGHGRYRKLLASNRAELVQEIMRVYRSINLLSVFEKAALTDALEDIDSAASFLETLGDVLESPSVTEATFDPYLKAVGNLPTPRGRVATWPVATIIPFLMQPDRHLFLKPTVTERAAKVLAFNLNYKAAPNWLTYRRLLDLAGHYMNQLKALKPRDMIDIQSFFWAVCGGYDKV